VNLITLIYLSLVSLTLVTYWPKVRQYKPYGFVVAYLGLILLTSLLAFLLTKYFQIKNNLFLFHLYSPLEYFILARLYANLCNNLTTRKWINGSIILYLLSAIVLSIFVQPINSNNSISVILESILMIVWSLVILREILLQKSGILLQRNPIFWIVVGVMFYFVGNMIIEGLLNFAIEQSLDLARRIYRMGYITKFVLIFLLLLGALCTRIFKDPFSDHLP